MDHIQYVRVIVVAAGHVTLDPGPGQPRLDQVHPCLQPLASEVTKQGIHRRTVALHRPEFILFHNMGIEAKRPNPVQKELQLGFGLDMLGPILERGPVVPTAFLNDRDEQFAGDVTPHHQHAHIVEFAGIDELAKGSFGSVNVSGKEKADKILAWFPGKEWHMIPSPKVLIHIDLFRPNAVPAIRISTEWAASAACASGSRPSSVTNL